MLVKITSIFNILPSLLNRADYLKTPRAYGTRSFKKGRKYDIDLTPYFEKFLRDKWEGDVDFSRYHIYLSHRSRVCNYKGVYRDALFSLILVITNSVNTEGYPIACIGFDIQPDSKSILVEQIQGVKGGLPYLGQFRWEKMLLKIVIDWARENRFSHVKVIRAQDCTYWSQENDEKNQRLYMKYDVTAKRMKFKYDEEQKVYVLDLTQN